MAAYALAHLRRVTMGPPIVEYLQRIDATPTPFNGRFIVHGGSIEVQEASYRLHSRYDAAWQPGRSTTSQHRDLSPGARRFFGWCPEARRRAATPLYVKTRDALFVSMGVIVLVDLVPSVYVAARMPRRGLAHP